MPKVLISDAMDNVAEKILSSNNIEVDIKTDLLAFAGQMFGIDIEVFMVKVSFDQKPYRKLMMQSFGGTCHPSPSEKTDFGKKLLSEDSNNPGSNPSNNFRDWK